MEQPTATSTSVERHFPAFLYFFGRIVIFLALIPNSYAGVGDLPEYMAWAALPGWPYFHYWSEFPPIFPLLNAGLYKLAGGQEFTYTLLLALLLAAAGGLCLEIFQRIAARIWSVGQARLRTWIYLGLLLPLPYTWWYFDLLPLAILLLGTLWLMEGRSWRSGLAVGVGMLLKWFPGVLLASAWRFRGPGQAGRVTAAACGLVVGVLAGLAVVSPQMTLASIKAQSSRSSWETVWALVDGNMTTGAFLSANDRLDPSLAGMANGNPTVISPFLTLIGFGLLGGWLFWHAQAQTDRALVAFLGITWVVFLAWSPGWSPQWILYVIPLILLSLPLRTAVFSVTALILVALVEYPVLLGRHFYESLWVIVPLRLIFFVWLGWRWQRLILQN